MAGTKGRLTTGTMVLDSEGLSKFCAADRRTVARVREAHDKGMCVSASAITLIEAFDMRTRNERFRWYLSHLRIEPVTDKLAFVAIELLREAGLHGHKYAIDAVVAATALQAAQPTIILTSDADDMAKLCGKTVRVVAV